MATMDPHGLREILEGDAQTLLREQSIYPILDYGWADDNLPSSRYTGLAMWLIDRPFELDFHFWGRDAPVEPTAREKALLLLGEDFVGTMDLARNALGLCLYCHANRKPDEILEDDEYFWEQRTTATVWLSTASDRIRDYFVIARFQITVSELINQDRAFKRFSHAFEIRDPRSGPYANDVLEKLKPLAERLADARQTRNKIIHEIASRRACNAALTLKLQHDEVRRREVKPNNLEDGAVLEGKVNF